MGKTRVKGSILKIGEENVFVEVYTKQKIIEICLPKTDFPKNIYYGMPIIISLKEKNGEKHYNITKGKIKSLSIIDKEFLNLISKYWEY